MSRKYRLPAGVGAVQTQDGSTFSGDASRQVTAADTRTPEMLSMGAAIVTTRVKKISVLKQIAAELVSISAAAIATNRALTLAGQPGAGGKLRLRFVIATAITAGVLTLIGKDMQGNAQTKTYTMIHDTTVTVVTDEAWSHVTSATITGLVGGGDGTFGIGQDTAIGLPVDSDAIAGTLVVFKASVDGVNDTVGTVDTVANTIVPNTAANGAKHMEFWYSFDAAA